MTTVRSPIRLGIVGCGAVAQICHLRALQAVPEFEILFLCDKNLQVARAAKMQFGLSAGTCVDVKEMAGQIDAAIVCTWPRFHLPITRDLLAMQVDVLCEKPAAMDSAEALEMSDLAREAGRIVAIGQWCRCLKNMWSLRAALSRGLLGRIEHIEASFGAALSWPMSSAAYFDRNLSAGGVMFDAGVHMVDLMVWLFGGIGQIRLEDDSYGGPEANARLSGTVFLSGAEVPCRIVVSWTHELRNSVHLIGERGEAEARFRSRDQVQLQLDLGGQWTALQMSADGIVLPFSSSNPYEAQLENFAHCVRTRSDPVTPVQSTVLPLEIIELAYSVRERMRQPWVEHQSGAQ